MEPSKYRPISLLNIGGKVLEKLLINRINHHMYKNALLIDSKYGFKPQGLQQTQLWRQKIHRNGTRKRKVVLMTSLDVEGAFNAAWWPSVLKGLKDAECPINLYYLSHGYFSQRTAVMTANNISLE